MIDVVLCYNLSDQVMCDAYMLCILYGIMDEFYVVCDFVLLDNVQKKKRERSLSWIVGREKIIIVCSVKRNAVRDSIRESLTLNASPRYNGRQAKLKNLFWLTAITYLFSILHFSVPSSNHIFFLIILTRHEDK